MYRHIISGGSIRCLVIYPYQFFSGEGGIRTHGALRLTRSPGARIRPDYATSPIINILLYFLRAELYYTVFKADSRNSFLDSLELEKLPLSAYFQTVNPIEG